MNEIKDERVRFYLKHQELIDAWAALASDASEEANRFLRSMTEDIEALASEIGSPWRANFAVDDPAWPMIGLVVPEWIDGTGRPLVEIGLLWDRRNVTFAGRARPVVAVTLDYGRELGKAVRQALRSEAAEVAKEHGYTVAQYWAFYRAEPAAGGAYWDDLTPYRQKLLQSVRETWEIFGEAAVAAYEVATSSGTRDIGASSPELVT